MIRGEIDHLLFQDESSIRDYQSLVNNWFPKGKQRIIPTYGNNKSVKLIGILNYETGHVYVQEEERYTAEIFLKFLQNPGIALAREVTEAAPTFDMFGFMQNAVLIFFCGAILVLAGMMVYEIYRTKKQD